MALSGRPRVAGEDQRNGERFFSLRQWNKHKKRRRELEDEDICSKGAHSVEEEEEEDGEEDEQGGEEEEDNGEEDEQGGEEEDDEVEEQESREIAVTIDRDVLHCSICSGKLRPPLFQCRIGHVMCSACCAKLDNKCHCLNIVSSIRCLALEKVIQSIRVPCSYAQEGCPRILSYTEREIHEAECLYSPCFCPYNECTFRGSTKQLSAHFTPEHRRPASKFSYNRPLVLYVSSTDAFLVLQGEDGRLFLLLQNGNFNAGRALSMTCLSETVLACDFGYELKIEHGETCLQLKASLTGAIRKWAGVYPTELYLLVPPEFCSSRGIVVEVCVRKI